MAQIDAMDYEDFQILIEAVTHLQKIELEEMEKSKKEVEKKTPKVRGR